MKIWRSLWQNLYAREVFFLRTKYAREVNVSNNSSIHLNNDEEKKKKRFYPTLSVCFPFKVENIFCLESRFHRHNSWTKNFGKEIESLVLQSKYKELYSLSHQYKNIFVNNFNFLIYKNENSKKKSCSWTINDNPKWKLVCLGTLKFPMLLNFVIGIWNKIRI